MFKKRLISTLILTPCVIILLFLLPSLQFKIIIFLICVLSAWEWGKLSNFFPIFQKIWISLISILLLTILQKSADSSFYDTQCNQYIVNIILTWWSIALVLVLSYPRSAKLWNQSSILWTTFGILTILPFFWSILILRNYCYNDNHYIGSWLLFYIMTLVWGMDSFSYIIGRIFGCHQTIPKLSPHKTWEGYLGGFSITTIIVLMIFKYIPIDIEFSKFFFYSLIIMLSSILGDLTESMLKREAGVKDSGQLIPGHGGLLDAIDGLYSTIPISTCLILLTN